MYICPVPTKEALQSAIQDLKLHDSTSFEEVRLLSNAEFIDLDPDRAKFFLELKRTQPNVVIDCQTLYTCGAPFNADYVLVPLKGKLWLEVCNDGSSPSTMHFLRACNHEWQRPEALPPRDKICFKRAKPYAHCGTLAELEAKYPSRSGARRN